MNDREFSQYILKIFSKLRAFNCIGIQYQLHMGLNQQSGLK